MKQREPTPRALELLYGVGLAIALAWLACGDRGGIDARGLRPNVLLISVDTLRRDHLGCYGYSRPTSPHIDGLAATGVLFENVTSVSSWTLPSHVSMLTGKYPAFHRVQDDGVKLAEQIPTLAEAFRDRGYQTLAVVSHVYVSSAFGLERGFEVFDDSMLENGKANPRAEKVVRRLSNHLENLSREQPFFAFVHFFDPHWDYAPPPPFDAKFIDPNYSGDVDGSYSSLRHFRGLGREMPAPDLRQVVGHYDAEIAYLDHQLGRLLAVLRENGLLKNRMIAFTGDHGEGFKEHGRLGHGWTLYEEQLGVPLIITGHPSLKAGTRRDDLVSTIDVAPTLLELAGESSPASFSGLPLFERRRTDEDFVFSESIRFGLEIRSVRGRRFKLIRSSDRNRWEFFDLDTDPGEKAPSQKDLSNGTLVAELTDYARSADSGWHLKFISLGKENRRVRVVLQTTGRFLDPRHYFSDNLPVTRARILGFDLSPDAKTLGIEVAISNHLGQVVFETEPRDATLRIRLEALESARDFGLFLGDGADGTMTGEVVLERSDHRVRKRVKNYFEAAAGVYVRAADPQNLAAPAAVLSDQARENLRALGYIE
jgi:arylsulfatase A-like enzyme